MQEQLILEKVQPETLSPEAVIWAYRLLLDRNPENQDVINDKIKKSPNFRELRRAFLLSSEFKQKNPDLRSDDFMGDEPPMKIEDVQSPQELAILFKHIQTVWQSLGETEPHWSVLTSDSFKQANLQSNKDAFYASGKRNIEQFFQTLKRNEIDYSGFKSCLEYGCGVGRLTCWLAERFQTVYGYDISQSHLKLAKEYFLEKGISNVTLQQVQQVQELEQMPKVDAIYTIIVLQHNPPPVIELTIRGFVKALNPGGVLFFQVPTYHQGYEFSLDKYMRSTKVQQIEMHVLPQRRIFEIVQQENGQVVEMVRDNSTGNFGISNTFLVQKR
jgi:2-polyprenyl-3-methyl-5-hydroxy-6-metoxy-1,4-benzoquinol methylase